MDGEPAARCLRVLPPLFIFLLDYVGMKAQYALTQTERLEKTMMTLEEVSSALSDRNLTEVGRRTGLHPERLRKIKNGDVKNPGFRTMARLIEYLEENK